jgi:small subunit ribosomal protein S21
MRDRFPKTRGDQTPKRKRRDLEKSRQSRRGMRGEAKSFGGSSINAVWPFSAGLQGYPARVFEKRLAIWPASPHLHLALGFIIPPSAVTKATKRRRFYEKPSEQAAREKSEAVRRLRKLARKQAIREGLIAAPKKKLAPLRKGAAPLPAMRQSPDRSR